MYSRLILVLFIGLVATAAHADSAIPDPEKWYTEGYAPHWSEDPQNMVDATTAYYADTIHSHAAAENVVAVNAREWLAVAIEGWAADGWVGSDLANIKVQRLNELTAVFETRWRDRYSSRADEFSCGWYLAGYANGKWAFTNYVEMECK